MATNNEYINGSNLLMKLGEKAIGHCTSHTLTFNAETKSRSVKAPFADSAESGLWDTKSINKRSCSINGEGLVFIQGTENDYADMLTLYKGTTVTIEGYVRGEENPYFTGSFVITSLVQNAPAGDDATYSFTAENSGEVTITPAKFTITPTPTA